MEEKTDRLYPPAPLMKSDRYLEHRLEKSLIDFKSFNNQINNIKELDNSFKDKNNKSKRNIKITKQ